MIDACIVVPVISTHMNRQTATKKGTELNEDPENEVEGNHNEHNVNVVILLFFYINLT